MYIFICKAGVNVISYAFEDEAMGKQYYSLHTQLLLWSVGSQLGIADDPSSEGGSPPETLPSPDLILSSYSLRKRQEERSLIRLSIRNRKPCSKINGAIQAKGRKGESDKLAYLFATLPSSITAPPSIPDPFFHGSEAEEAFIEWTINDSFICILSLGSGNICTYFQSLTEQPT